MPPKGLTPRRKALIRWRDAVHAAWNNGKRPVVSFTDTYLWRVMDSLSPEVHGRVAERWVLVLRQVDASHFDLHLFEETFCAITGRASLEPSPALMFERRRLITLWPSVEEVRAYLVEELRLEAAFMDPGETVPW